MKNVYLATVRGLPMHPARWNDGVDFHRALDAEMDVWRRRRALVQVYAWAVPNDEALALLEREGPIVEIGAGGGYWAALLRDRGVDIVAYDLEPGFNTQVARLWTHVEQGDASVAGEHPERTLFLCWPPYSDPMGAQALGVYLDAGGRKLALVGEDRGGCTGDDDLFDLIATRMRPVESVAIPQFPGAHDWMELYERT